MAVFVSEVRFFKQRSRVFVLKEVFWFLLKIFTVYEGLVWIGESDDFSSC